MIWISEGLCLSNLKHINGGLKMSISSLIIILAIDSQPRGLNQLDVQHVFDFYDD